MITFTESIVEQGALVWLASLSYLVKCKFEIAFSIN